MIQIQPLRQDQLRQVAEWEFGPQPPDADWDRYAAEMNAPKWTHYGLYVDGVFVGCLSLERTDRQMLAYHVVTGRHKVHPNALAQVLLKTAGILFRQGFTALTACIPRNKRAAAKLAIRCGMRELSHEPDFRHFLLTPADYSEYRS